MIEAPSTNVVIGHDTNGRFAAGNTLGRGNPHAAQTAKLRSAMLSAVTEDDVKAVVGKLVALAKDGDVPAIKLLFDRVLGKVVAIVEPAISPITVENFAERKAALIARAERLEQRLTPADNGEPRLT